MEIAPDIPTADRGPQPTRTIVALRMDDVGSASKIHEQYSKRWWPFGNVGILKRLVYFKAWGPYRELTTDEWDGIITVLADRGAKLTVGVTAAWVDHDGRLTPFPQKFPEQAAKIREGVQAQLLEVANHGLTHCVLQGQRFRPRLFTTNRKYHREFWSWLPEEVHFDHIRRSQEILESFFSVPVTTLIPPGNVYCDVTARAAQEHGLTTFNCIAGSPLDPTCSIRLVGNENVLAFHDRDIVLLGLRWLREIIAELPRGLRFCFVREL